MQEGSSKLAWHRFASHTSIDLGYFAECRDGQMRLSFHATVGIGQAINAADLPTLASRLNGCCTILSEFTTIDSLNTSLSQ